MFRRETEPLIEHYRKYRIVIEVDAGQSPSSVTRNIAVALTAFRKASLDGNLYPNLDPPFLPENRGRTIGA